MSFPTNGTDSDKYLWFEHKKVELKRQLKGINNEQKKYEPKFLEKLNTVYGGKFVPPPEEYMYLGRQSFIVHTTSRESATRKNITKYAEQYAIERGLPLDINDLMDYVYSSLKLIPRKKATLKRKLEPGRGIKNITE